jgi:sulfate transport system substrate-binding protein
MIHPLSHYLTKPGWRNLPALALLAVIGALIIYHGGSGTRVNARATTQLVVYAFSTQEDVLTQAIFPAFEQKWEAETGQELSIEGVFGPSGTLAGQINLGAPADVAIFSNARQVMWLKIGRRVRMESEPVLIGTTPMIIVTRLGNPFDISEFADLAQPGLRLIHANPRSSGAGEWAVLAEYGSAYLASGSQIEAERHLKGIWHNVRLLTSSAQAAMALFELGAGDAFVTYEQDAKFALARGIPLEIVIPPRTIVAKHLAVIIDNNLTPAERPVAKAFVQYLQSDSGQGIFQRYYQRPVGHHSAAFQKLLQPFTVEDLGGWNLAYDELILSLWQEEIEPGLELQDVSVMLEPRE